MNLGKCWAAIKDEKVIGTISMQVPEWVDFDEYKDRARLCLSLLGDVKAGQVIRTPKGLVFMQRQNHKNRSKKPAEPVEYPFHTPVMPRQAGDDDE